MKLLEEKIRKEGQILSGNILKVSSFLNHQIDVLFLDNLAQEFVRRFEGEKITKVLTIEASGIGIGSCVARAFKCPLVFAKKNSSKNVNEDCYRSSVYSYTHSKTYNIIVVKNYISSDDNVLIIDDFLANGSALNGLIELVSQAGAKLAGCGIVIEKGFQEGGALLRQKGYKIESLAIVDSMSVESGVEFRKDN